MFWTSGSRSKGAPAGAAEEPRAPGPRLMVLVAIASAALAAAATLLVAGEGPRGRRWRTEGLGHALAVVRHRGRRLAKRARYLRSTALGITQRVAHRTPQPAADDYTLLDRVESEVFADPGVPKGEVNLDVVKGIVALRGELESPEMIGRLEKATLAVPGVRGVKSYLHLPGQPAPNKASALSAQVPGHASTPGA